MAVFAHPFVYGDSIEGLGLRTRSADQLLEQNYGAEPFPFAEGVIGDAPTRADRAQGGADVVRHFGGVDSALAIGDAETISGRARGGNDAVVAGARGGADAYGDALLITGHGVGGDDVVSAFSRFYSAAYGDAGHLDDRAIGGDDTVTGSTDSFFSPTLFGDARTIGGRAQGGDDLLSVSGGVVYGDAEVLADRSVGGDDTLVSGFGSDRLFGDAAVVEARAQTGSDLFVFSPDSGQDEVMDFEPAKDRIALDGFGFTGLEEVAGLMQSTSDGVLISFAGGSQILLRGVGVSDLSAGNFLLG